MRIGPVLLLGSLVFASSCSASGPRPAESVAGSTPPSASPAGSSSSATAPEPGAIGIPSASAQPSVPGLSPARRAGPTKATARGHRRTAHATPDPPSETAEPTPSAPPRESVQIQLEDPHKLFQRPHAAGAVLAAGQDELLARWNLGGTGDPAFISNQPHYHPGARVVVDTKVLLGNLPRGRAGRPRGVLTRAGVLARARKYGYWPIRICFEAGLRRDQKLHGKTVIRLTLSANGKVAATRLVDTELEDRAVAECLADELQSLEFLPPPRRRVDIETSVKLWPGHAPVPLRGPPDEDFEEAPGQLDATAARVALQDRLPAIRTCYREGLGRDPGLWGRIQLQVDQDANGCVLGIRETESRFPDPAVARCIVAALRSLELPKPKGGRLSFVYGVRLGRLRASN